jgi:GT2 family glycosyltransferase
VGDTNPQLSVVVPTLGDHGRLAQVLDGFERQDAVPGSFELVVVADRAEPDPEAVRAAVGRRDYPVRLLTGERPGASSNRNVGWRAARAPIVLFTDNDTVPVPRLIAEHTAWHQRFPAAEVAVLGLVRWPRGLRVTPFMKWLEHGVQFDFDSISGTEASWAHVYTANLSVKRSFLHRVGGYDERRLPYLYEDLDWGYRAREHGLRVMFNRRAVVDHWRPMTVATWQARAPALAAGEWQFCRLHPDVPPWFQPMFANAAALPAGGRRSAAVVRFVPRRTPWLGPIVWGRAALHWCQAIAPHFLAAWERASADSGGPVQPAGAGPPVEPTTSSAGS